MKRFWKIDREMQIKTTVELHNIANTTELYPY